MGNFSFCGVRKVMEQLREKGVGRDAWWGSILERRLFMSASDGGSASLAHLVAIFVERQHLVWKPPEVRTEHKRIPGL